MSRLRAYNLEVRYADRPALKDVSLDVPSGAITVLLGPNGAGKSTLLNALAGDIRPYSGRVELDGTAITSFSAIDLADLRAVLPQGSPLSFPFTVYEIVRLGIRDQSDPALTDTMVQKALSEADLEGYGARHFQQLSGGEQQRVHIARVLAQLQPVKGKTPALLFLDEPTASLDLKHQFRTMEVARRFAQSGGTVVAVLHDFNLASTHADEVVLLANSQMLDRGPPERVLTPSLISQAFQAFPRFDVDDRGKPYILPPVPGKPDDY